MQLKDFPSFKTDLGTIYNGDCIHVMSAMHTEGIKVDMILTDPPYGIDYTGRSKDRDHEADKIKDDDTLRNVLTLFDRMLPLMNCITVEHAEWYVFATGWTKDQTLFHIWKKLKEYANIDNMLIWNKKSIGMGQDWRHQYEVCFQSKFGNGLTKAQSDGNVLSIKKIKVTEDDHPTQKPFALLHKIISVKKPSVVFDPFAGSGQTALACERLGIKWFACELKEKFYKMAKEDLKDENTQGKLF